MKQVTVTRGKISWKNKMRRFLAAVKQSVIKWTYVLAGTFLFVLAILILFPVVVALPFMVLALLCLAAAARTVKGTAHVETFTVA